MADAVKAESASVPGLPEIVESSRSVTDAPAALRQLVRLGLVAVVASVTNIVSGFLITDRMLKMFRKKEEIKPQ